MSTPTNVQSPPSPDREALRRARVRAITDGARVRQALSQAALYERVDGVHVIVFRGQRFRAPTVDAVIEAASEGDETER